MTSIQPTDADDHGSAFFSLHYSQLLSEVATVATSFKAPAESHWSLVSNAQIGLIVSITNPSNHTVSVTKPINYLLLKTF